MFQFLKGTIFSTYCIFPISENWLNSIFREEVEEFFNDMDRDFDERLTFEEFMGEESHIEKVFKSMDKNGDGFVTKEEFQSVCKNLSDDQV